MKNKLLLILLFISNLTLAQEFLAEVKVDYSQVQNSNSSTFKNLEKSLKNFINTTKWTDENYKIYQKIEAAFNIIILQKEGSNKYKANLLIQSRRPVYNTTYYSPIINIKDNHFEFEYTDYQPLVFDERKHSHTNLSDVIGFYIYLILGYDADSFAHLAGTPYFKIAEKVASNAQNSSFSGWDLQSPRSRTSLVNNLLSPKGQILREVFYNYHFKGLDRMRKSELEAKNNIGKTLIDLDYYLQKNDYTQNYALDIFFDTKKNEITQIFSDGLNTTFGLSKLKELLNKIAPNDTELWQKMNK